MELSTQIKRYEHLKFNISDECRYNSKLLDIFSISEQCDIFRHLSSDGALGIVEACLYVLEAKFREIQKLHYWQYVEYIMKDNKQ